MNLARLKISPIRTISALIIGITWVALLFWGHHDIAGGRFINSATLHSLLWLIPVLILVEATRSRWNISEPEHSKTHTAELVLLGCMTLYLMTGATRDVWFYFIDWVPLAGDTSLHGFAQTLNVFLFLIALTWPPFLLARGRLRFGLIILGIFVFSQGLSALRLWRTTGGAALYRDDHPSFMFRLDQAADILPHLEAYVPFWNGGVVDRVIGETGATAPAILLWPLWRFFDVDQVYTLGFSVIYIILLPWLCVLSLRMMKLNWPTCAIAGLLGLAVSQDYFLWVLHFGTLGAGISSTFILPFSASLYQIVQLERRDIKSLLCLTLSAFFLVLWPPGFIMAGLATLSVLSAARKLNPRALLFLALGGFAALLLDVRMLAVLVLKSQSLLDFVFHHHGDTGAEETAVLGRTFKEGLFMVLSIGKKMNPLILFLGLGGMLTLQDRKIKHWIWPPVLGLLLIAVWVSPHLEELQLERLMLPLEFLAIVPAAITASRCLEPTHFRLAPLKAVLIAMLLLTGWNASRIYANRGPAPYTTLSPEVRALATYFNETVPEGGRVLFAGHNVHSFGGGHIAYLPLLAKREMMACDYYHFPIKMVEYDYPPRAYRRPEVMLGFLDTYNVTHIVTRFEHRRQIFEDLGDPYVFDRKVTLGNVPAYVFRVDRPANLFLQGEGHVDASFNHLEVTLPKDATETILKYNYSEGLRASGKAELFPHPVDDTITLLGIRPKGETQIQIHYRTWF